MPRAAGAPGQRAGQRFGRDFGNGGDRDAWGGLFTEDCTCRLVPHLLHADVQCVDCEADCAAFCTTLDGPGTVFKVGRSLDSFLRTPEGLRIASGVCVCASATARRSPMPSSPRSDGPDLA